MEDIRRMTLSNLHKLTRAVHTRAEFMDPESNEFMEDFKFVWGFTRETMKVVPGLEPKQEAGPQLVININDLPGVADALNRPVVDTLAHRTIDVSDIELDAPEPKYGSSDDSLEPTLAKPQESDDVDLYLAPAEEIAALLGDFDMVSDLDDERC